MSDRWTIFWTFIIVGGVIFWTLNNQWRANACVEHGYSPIYAGRYGAVEYCERTVNGQSDTIDPADLP